MTDRQTVRARFSRAYLDWYADQPRPFTIWSSNSANPIGLGDGETEDEAWTNAAWTVQAMEAIR